MDSSCNTFGVIIGEQKFDKLTLCVKIDPNIWGKFEAIYDETIVNSSTKSYSFEFDDPKSVIPCSQSQDHNELKRRKRRCTSNITITYVEVPVDIYFNGPYPSLNTLIDINGQARYPDPLIRPYPSIITDYPGLPVIATSNAFQCNGHYTYRLLSRSMVMNDFGKCNLL